MVQAEGAVVGRTTGQYVAPGGAKLFTRAWLPAGSPRALILLVHGVAEHSGRYEHVGAFLAERGYAVYTMDLRGHGQSDGTPGYIDHADTYIEDLHGYFVGVRVEHPDVPAFVLGHSMGAMLTLIFAGRYEAELSGALSSAAAVVLGDAVPGYLKQVARVLSAVVPKMPLQALDAGTVSRDPAVQQAYDSDPLNYRGKLSARLGTELLALGNRARAAVQGMHIPLLLMHGSADSIADPVGLDQLYRLAASPDKTRRLYDGLYHEIFNEPEQAEVLADVAAWLDAHTA